MVRTARDLAVSERVRAKSDTLPRLGAPVPDREGVRASDTPAVAFYRLCDTRAPHGHSAGDTVREPSVGTGREV
jgi:hypothetical protein